MSSQLELERITNTYYYAVTSDDGESRTEIGDFDITIPPFPQQLHNSATRCIFTLLGVGIGDQLAGQLVGLTSFISIDIAGLGLNANNYNSDARAAADVGMRQTNRFLIPNTEEEFSAITTIRGGGGAISDTIPVQGLTGDLDITNPYVMACSNPVGKSLSFKLFNAGGGAIPANGNLNTIVRFKIEIVPN
tara:strand:+ start:1113 stop:1685 length:573 start_codon:yes stop_codon:yes gene_type:complete